ncbi:MAG TPA: mechanosensitive ion channel [Burkholderiaceae bacterium]|nr:mechanosensitive ion channel [Burkholderiaceae bacterium]
MIRRLRFSGWRCAAWLAPWLVVLALCGAAAAGRAAVVPSAPAPSPDVLQEGLALAEAGAPGQTHDNVRLTIYNRPIITFREPLLNMSPAERASRARFQIDQIMSKRGPLQVSLSPFQNATIVMVDGAPAFPFVSADLGPGQTANEVRAALQQALDEGREASSVTFMLRATGIAAIATIVLALVLWGLSFLGRRMEGLMKRLAEKHGSKIALGGAPLFGSERLFRILNAALRASLWVLALIAVVEWLGFSMSQFPYTRRWGEQMNQSALDLANFVFGAIADSLPGLAVALAIFVLARAALGLVSPLFAQVERGELELRWIDKDTVRATRRLVQLGVWLFALAMAYPYLPGAQTEAFKGMSVLLGLMVSLGASNMLGQAISGLIVTYSHTMRVGEYVRVGDFEGTVTQVGTFSTRVRTGMGEELTVPNTLIVGSVTRNYSRSMPGSGYIVDTELTIGYDAPWRQVHAMMIEAALRTEGISQTPPPKVFQTALSDYYAEYRIAAHAVPTQPLPRAELLGQLHANLQDVFNENGVQIMSPHYMGDPERAKVVPRAEWDPPLAAKG